MIILSVLCIISILGAVFCYLLTHQNRGYTVHIDSSNFKKEIVDLPKVIERKEDDDMDIDDSTEIIKKTVQKKKKEIIKKEEKIVAKEPEKEKQYSYYIDITKVKNKDLSTSITSIKKIIPDYILSGIKIVPMGGEYILRLGPLTDKSLQTDLMDLFLSHDYKAVIID